MLDIDVILPQDFLMCVCKVREGNRFRLRNAHFFREELRQTIDEERLPRRLTMQRLNYLRRERLPNLRRILSKEFVHLREREV